jgi:hypothetical protein
MGTGVMSNKFESSFEIVRILNWVSKDYTAEECECSKRTHQQLIFGAEHKAG